MSFKRWPKKDPTDYFDHSVDWADRLAVGDTIATVTWVLPEPLTSELESNTTTITTIWIGGGVAGTSYNVNVTVVTAMGREFNRTIVLPVKEL